MMRFSEELLPADEIGPADGREASRRETQLAEHLVNALAGPFDPAKHPDEYRSAILSAVEEKLASGQVAREESGEAEAPATAATGGRVFDLAELLSRSIKAAAKPGPAKATRARGPAAAKREKTDVTLRKKRAAS